jgi:hypothetical protein
LFPVEKSVGALKAEIPLTLINSLFSESICDTLYYDRDHDKKEEK